MKLSKCRYFEILDKMNEIMCITKFKSIKSYFQKRLKFGIPLFTSRSWRIIRIIQYGGQFVFLPLSDGPSICREAKNDNFCV